MAVFWFRDNRAIPIIKKVQQRATEMAESRCTVTKPFGLTVRSNYKGSVLEPFEGAIPLIYNNRIGYSRPDQIQRNHQWIDRWKVLLPMASSGDTPIDEHGRIVDVVPGSRSLWHRDLPARRRISSSACSTPRRKPKTTRIILRPSSSDSFVLQRKTTQHVTPTGFASFPMLDMTRRWTDDDLYAHFALTDDEIDYIESTSNRAPSTCRSTHPSPRLTSRAATSIGSAALTSRRRGRGRTGRRRMTAIEQSTLQPEELETVGSRAWPGASTPTRCPARTPAVGAHRRGTDHRGTGLIKGGRHHETHVLQRIKQQLGTTRTRTLTVCSCFSTPQRCAATAPFRDHDVHRALVAKGIRKDAEWFEATVEEVRPRSSQSGNTRLRRHLHRRLRDAPEQEEPLRSPPAISAPTPRTPTPAVSVERQDAVR